MLLTFSGMVAGDNSSDHCKTIQSGRFGNLLVERIHFQQSSVLQSTLIYRRPLEEHTFYVTSQHDKVSKRIYLPTSDDPYGMYFTHYHATRPKRRKTTSFALIRNVQNDVKLHYSARRNVRDNVKLRFSMVRRKDTGDLEI